MVLSCCGPQPNNNCQGQFKPVLTEHGICYSFNPTSWEDSLKATPYTDIFKTVFGMESANITDPVKLRNVGNVYKMHITLDSHQSKLGFEKSEGSFSISLNARNEYMKSIDEEIKISLGYHTSIRVTPKQFKSTDSFKKLSLEKRGCQYEHETNNNLRLFK